MVQKCEDPIHVTVVINIDAGGAEVEQQYEVTTEMQTRTIDNTAVGNVGITTSRNDTQMNFMVGCIMYEDITCMCRFYLLIFL